MDHETVMAYLTRIGVTAPADADAEGLRMLHRAHQLTVPFENLSIHLAEPIRLDERELIDKIVRRGRGGFCYELNGAFALLLEALGAQVSRVAARVYGEAGPGPPFDHLALIVRPADGSGPWLADVGFGSHSDYPLLLEARADQDDPAGRFRIAEAGHGDLDVLRDGRPQYRIETRERSLADCIPTCWWQQTSPLSHFTQSTICAGRPGRLTKPVPRVRRQPWLPQHQAAVRAAEPGDERAGGSRYVWAPSASSALRVPSPMCRPPAWARTPNRSCRSATAPRRWSRGGQAIGTGWRAAGRGGWMNGEQRHSAAAG